MRSSRFFFGLLLVIVISTTYLFVGGFKLGPRFNITNNTAQAVTVIASWREQNRTLGPIEPDATMSLTVRDEASMVFTVRYADGREMASEAVYFSTGVTIDVTISEDNIDVKYNSDT